MRRFWILEATLVGLSGPVVYYGAYWHAALGALAAGLAAAWRVFRVRQLRRRRLADACD